MFRRHKKVVFVLSSILCVLIGASGIIFAVPNRSSENHTALTRPVQHTLMARTAGTGSNSEAEAPVVWDSTPPVSGQKLPKDFLKFQQKYHLVPIPTYDGSYQLTHPKVLYFPEKWNGYKYWMSMTPYPYEHDIYENPSIVVSNDGKSWVVPKGLKNPVTGLPPDVKTGGHYSDPQLAMVGKTMQLWFRYNPARPNKVRMRLPNNAVNYYLRETTTDGIHWSKPEKLLVSKDGHLSLCVNYEDNIFKTWYATYGGKLMYSQSKDAHNWSAPAACTVPLPKGYQPYHQDMIRYNGTYYLLQTAEKTSNYTFSLFLLSSEDGLHFKNLEQIYPSKDMALWKNVSFYRSTVFVKDQKLSLYISMIIPHLRWYMTQVTIPIPKAPATDKPQIPSVKTAKTAKIVKV